MAIATDHAATVVFEEMLVETGLTDHSLAQLRKMGHPYGQGKAQGQPHPDWLVHHQEGSLQEGLSRSPVSEKPTCCEVAINSAADHTWFLLLGTRRMRPRDFVLASLIQTQKATSAIYEHYFKAALDTKGNTPFRVKVSHIVNERYAAQLPKK